MTEPSVTWSPTARRDLQRLPESVATAVIELVYGALTDEPTRLGKPMQGQFVGLWVARRGDYRVIFRPGERGLEIITIAHRRDAYRPR